MTEEDVRELYANRQAGFACPFGEAGDELWVRETLKCDVTGQWRYAIDDAPVELDVGDPRVASMIAWAHHTERTTCTSIHMPRFASRIRLKVTDVRLERLHDISEDDIKREGVEIPLGDCTRKCKAKHPGKAHLLVQVTTPHGAALSPDATARDFHVSAFACAWEDLHGKRAPWSINPWVWVVTFERI